MRRREYASLIDPKFRRSVIRERHRRPTEVSLFALTRILVPTNLGAPSQTAIKYGVAFARQFNAQLFLLQVLPAKDFDAAIETERVMAVLAADGSSGAAAPEPSPAAAARAAAREGLGSLLDARDERDTRAEYLLRAAGGGGPGDAIIACAAELDVELIVIGKHRVGFVAHLFAGSVTENVMRHAPCPVLIVHHPEHDFVVPDG
jgi:nucleotide-binding universal stress UspA family protein